MSKLNELTIELGRLRTEIGEMAPAIEGDATAEQVARFDAATAEFDAKMAERDALLGRIERAKKVAGSPVNVERGAAPDDLNEDFIGDPASVRDAAGKYRDPWDLSPVRTWDRTPDAVGSELKARAASAIEQMPQMTDRRRSALQDIVERFDDDRGTLARQVLLTSSPDYLRAFAKIIRGNSHLLNEVERRAVERAMSTTDNAGGFLIPQQLDPTLILTSDGSVNPFRQLARTVVARGDRYDLSSTGHAVWSYDGEGVEASDDSTTFANPAITIFKAQGFIPISIEALGDIPNVAEEVGRLLRLGKDDLEAARFATGAAAGGPIGIVTALAGTSSVVNSATTDVFAVGDVFAVEEALPAKYRTRAAWTANKPIYNDIRQFGNNDGMALWERLANGQPPQLLGYGAHEASGMDGTITATADNHVLILGDWEYYVIADRMGVEVEYVATLFGAGGRPTGQRGWHAWLRHGADSVNDGAFRMLNIT